MYKTADADHFLETLRVVADGQENRDLSPSGTNQLSGAELLENLTAREMQVVKLIVEGQSTLSAADALGISAHTVRKHRENINSKLGAPSPAALAALAIKSGLV